VHVRNEWDIAGGSGWRAALRYPVPATADNRITPTRRHLVRHLPHAPVFYVLCGGSCGPPAGSHPAFGPAGKPLPCTLLGNAGLQQPAEACRQRVCRWHNIRVAPNTIVDVKGGD